jgi:hypothetical protein
MSRREFWTNVWAFVGVCFFLLFAGIGAGVFWWIASTTYGLLP